MNFVPVPAQQEEDNNKLHLMHKPGPRKNESKADYFCRITTEGQLDGIEVNVGSGWGQGGVRVRLELW